MRHKLQLLARLHESDRQDGCDFARLEMPGATDGLSPADVIALQPYEESSRNIIRQELEKRR
jgi:hypothetical protein